jgi:hypothetical protein
MGELSGDRLDPLLGRVDTLGRRNHAQLPRGREVNAALQREFSPSAVSLRRRRLASRIEVTLELKLVLAEVGNPEPIRIPKFRVVAAYALAVIHCSTRFRRR